MVGLFVVCGWLLFVTCLVVGCNVLLLGCSSLLSFVGWLVGLLVGCLVVSVLGCVML